MQRLLQGVPGPVSLLVYDAAGELVDLDAPPTVVVRDGAGVEVQSGAAVRDATGTYSFTVSQATTLLPLDEFGTEWSGARAGDPATFGTSFATVGQPGFYFTVADMRTFNRAVADDVKYPAAAIVAAREYAEERIDGVAQVAFVPRGRRYRLRLRGTARSLLLPDAEVREVYALTIDGTAVAAADFYPVNDGLVRADGSGWEGGLVDVHYAHGLDRPQEPVRRGSMMLALDYLVPSTLDARAKFQAIENVGTFGISQPDRSGSTGIPEVDAVCAKYGRQRPAVG